MDLSVFNILLFLFSSAGICLGSGILPGPVDAVLGTNVTLKVLKNIENATIIMWSFSDGIITEPVVNYQSGTVTVAPQYEGKASIDPTSGSLILTGLTAKDSGDYSIAILIQRKMTTGKMKLRVLEPVSTVVITPDVTETKEGGTVTLKCSAKGSFLEFIWTNGSSHITVDGDRITQKSEGEFSTKLTIRYVYRSDFSSSIFCTAKNGLESEKSHPFTLTVFYGPDMVSINPAKPAEFIKSKADFNLTCSAASKPDAVFSWYYNNQQIKNSGPVLTLKTIEEQGLGKTAGDYKCNAVNSKTTNARNSSAVRFSVVEPLSGINITGPNHTLIAGNTTANLSCHVSVGKVTKTVWLRNNVPLSASPRVVFSSDMSSVEINPVQKDDNGNFMCVVENPVSKEKAEYKMVVIYGPEEAAIVGEKEVDLEGKVTLNCSAISVPPSIYTWKLNGTKKTEKSNVLIINKSKFQDSGTYICEAQNPITGKTVTFSHFLSVKEEMDDSLSLSDGAIAGIVIACLAVVAIAIGLFYYCHGKIPVGYNAGKLETDVSIESPY